MSKEKECKCCHEWWYSSDIKNDLCPNCYDYFKQLKQQLAEKDEKIKRFMSMKNREQIIAENEALKDTIAIVLAQKRNVVQHKTQLAIQELEKVKDYIQKHKYKTLKEDRHIVYYKSLKDQIDNQIKALKGNNDEPRQSN